MRLWGADAIFDTERYRVPFSSRVYTGRELLSLFLDDHYFRRFVVSVDPIMRVTDNGVMVEESSTRLRMEGELVHVDKLLRACAEIGIAPSVFVRASNGESSVGEMVRFSIARFDARQELEWTLEALARYIVPAPGWTNRFGEAFTFDDAIQILVERKRGEGPCLGIHVPYVLAILLRLDDGYRFLRNSSRLLVTRYLRKSRHCSRQDSRPTELGLSVGHRVCHQCTSLTPIGLAPRRGSQ